MPWIKCCKAFFFPEVERTTSNDLDYFFPCLSQLLFTQFELIKQINSRTFDSFNSNTAFLAKNDRQ